MALVKGVLTGEKGPVVLFPGALVVLI